MLKCERGGGTDKALERCNTCTHTHTHTRIRKRINSHDCSGYDHTWTDVLMKGKHAVCNRLAANVVFELFRKRTHDRSHHHANHGCGEKAQYRGAGGGDREVHRGRERHTEREREREMDVCVKHEHTHVHIHTHTHTHTKGIRLRCRNPVTHLCTACKQRQRHGPQVDTSSTVPPVGCTAQTQPSGPSSLREGEAK